MPDVKTAKEKVQAAADLCVAAGQALDRYEQFKTDRDGVKLKVPAAATVIDPLIEAINTKVTEAEKKAKLREFSPAAALLDQIAKDCVAAVAVKQASEAYDERLKKVKPGIDGLTTTSPRKDDPKIGADIEKTDKAVKDAADQAATTPATLAQFQQAMKHLDDAAVRCEAAKAKKKMLANQVPDADDLKKIVAGPGGPALLDEIVKGLGVNANREVLYAAMKVRFNLDMAQSFDTDTKTAEAGTTKDADLSVAKIYELMTKVPDSHIKDNPSFKKIKRRPGSTQKGSYYSDTEGEVVLGEGRPDTSSDYTVGDSNQLPAIDPNCVCKGGTPPKFFNWNTLHEVGHAVDDKKGFMKKNFDNADFGGWRAHGGDVMVVARAVDGKFAGVTAEMIAKYLSEGTLPTGPVASSAPWTKCKAWCDGIRHGTKPWSKGNLCNKSVETGGLMVGDRVYHEAYANDWYSYLAAARTKGVTGYQFRAPGEWFCELYAAYGTGKLNDSHPAGVWLKKLFKVTA